MSFIKSSSCPFCGSNGFVWIGDHGKCEYCGGTMIAPKEEKPVVNVNAKISCEDFTTIKYNELYRKIRNYKGDSSEYIKSMIEELRCIDPKRPERHWLDIVRIYCDNCNEFSEVRNSFGSKFDDNKTYKEYVDNRIECFLSSVKRQRKHNQYYAEKSGNELWEEFSDDMYDDINRIINGIYGSKKNTEEIRTSSMNAKRADQGNESGGCGSFALAILSAVGAFISIMFFHSLVFFIVFVLAAGILFIASIAASFNNESYTEPNYYNKNAWNSYIEWVKETFNFKTEEELEDFLKMEDRYIFYSDKKHLDLDSFCWII